MANGANLAEARRLAEIKETVRKKEGEAQEVGWNIQQSHTVEDGDYLPFLGKLLQCQEVVNTGDVKIHVCERFAVKAGTLWIDHRAPMEDILEFLKS